MKIYTRTGDEGQTGLLGGTRVPKDAARIEFCGAADELNSALGLARAAVLPEDLDRLLDRIQHELFRVGAEVASADRTVTGIPVVTAAHVRAQEEAIDRYTEELPPLTHFILPGGVPGAAALHLARSVCRRAERRLAALAHAGPPPVSADLLAYMNRLSDLLFVLARVANARVGVADVLWHEHPT